MGEKYNQYRLSSHSTHGFYASVFLISDELKVVIIEICHQIL